MSFIKYALFYAVIGSCLVSYYVSSSSYKYLSLNQHVQLELSETSCPLENTGTVDNDVTQLGKFARTLTHDTYSNIIQAVEQDEFKHSKIVFIGDSNMKKVFSNFACAAHSKGLWENDNSYTTDNSVAWTKKATYEDARFNLKDGLGEFFYAPSAGKIIHNRQTEDWIWNCHERKPFYLDAVSFFEPNAENDASDPHFERIILREWDIVVFNEGEDPETKEKNLRNYNLLQRCIQRATELDVEAGWPKFIHMESDKELHVEDTGTLQR